MHMRMHAQMRMKTDIDATALQLILSSNMRCQWQTCAELAPAGFGVGLKAVRDCTRQRLPTSAGKNDGRNGAAQLTHSRAAAAVTVTSRDRRMLQQKKPSASRVRGAP
jgi:hypothetical protein